MKMSVEVTKFDPASVPGRVIIRFCATALDATEKPILFGKPKGEAADSREAPKQPVISEVEVTVDYAGEKPADFASKLAASLKLKEKFERKLSEKLVMLGLAKESAAKTYKPVEKPFKVSL